MIKQFIKDTLKVIGLKIERIDPLEETIPTAYNKSPFLPRVYRGAFTRYQYILDIVEKTNSLEGDIVECGVSIGHGALLFLLCCDYVGINRKYHGFDSFEGFPDPIEKDEVTPIKGKGFWANPPDTVLKVLEDGRISDDIINNNVKLYKGYFEDTLMNYHGKIALLHLDCDLYESYKISLESLYDKVVKDGIIMFDEYNDNRWPGATKAIDEFFSGKPEKIIQHEKCSWKYFVVKQ